jgi:5-methylcytosine-specific restriction endonuclease McrA
VQFTASAALVGKLEELQALLSHREAGRDLALVIEQAVDLLRNKLVKERFGQGAHRRRRRQPTSKEAGPHEAQAERTRHVPREIRRQVVERDEHQCAYVDPDSGRRCSERRFLELQHHQPYGRGGRHSVDNISLFCRAHNQFQARRDYGGARIDAAVAARRTASWSRDQSPPLQLDLVGGEP